MNLEGCLRQLRVVRRAEDINVVFQWYSLVGWVQSWISQDGHDTVPRRGKEGEKSKGASDVRSVSVQIDAQNVDGSFIHYHQCHQDGSQMTTMRSSNEPEGWEGPLSSDAFE